MSHTYYKKPKLKKNRRKRRKIEKRAASAQKRTGKRARGVKQNSSKKSASKNSVTKYVIIIVGLILALGFIFGRLDLDKYLEFDNIFEKTSQISPSPPQLASPKKEEGLPAPTSEEKARQDRLIEAILNKKDEKLLALSASQAGVSQKKLVSVIEDANAYMHKMLDNKGKFTYRHNLNPDVRVPPKYNMLRHAGSIYSMVMYEQALGDGSSIPQIIQASNYLKKTSLKPVGNKGMLGIWSYDRITGSRDPDQVKLGGAGLSLVALLSTEQLAKGTSSLNELRQLGEFILYMQKRDGSFYSKYIPTKGGRDASWISLYYPGEAALGLVMLYEFDSNPKWLMGAAKALAYLSSIRIGKKRVEADHWALLASARLLPLYDRLETPPVDKQMILEHAIQICGSILDQAARNILKEGQYGCFGFDGRTTPTATRLEGLQAALTFIPTSHNILHERIRASVDLGIAFLMDAQIKEGTHKGAILRGTRQLESGMSEKDLRNFNRRATEFRIDYVQHPLSAFIQYGEMNGMM